MKLAEKFLTTIAIQSIGPLSLFIVVWSIGKTLGPEMQGRFSALKSFVDLSATVLMFGLPQSFIYGINRLGVQRGLLMRWTFKYGAACFLLVLVLLLAARGVNLPSIAFASLSPLAPILLSLAIAGLVIHGILRGIFLTIDDGTPFSMLTILPALLLCAASMLLLLGWFDMPALYAVVGLLSAVAAARFARRSLMENDGNSLPWKQLLGNGSTVFIQSSVMAAQPFIAFSLLGRYGGFEDIAFFSLALYVNQAAIVPLTMTAPLLFNRWSVADSGGHVSSDLAKLFRPLPLIVTGVAICWFATPAAMAWIFGQSYDKTIPAIQIMLLGLPFIYMAFVGMPALMSIGEFRSNSGVVILRLLTFTALAFLLLDLPGMPGSAVTRTAAAWLASEALMGTMVIALLAKRFRKADNTTLSILER